MKSEFYDLGVKSYVALDVTQDYYQHAIKYMIFGNVLKNGTYPISVTSERISQATAIAKYAREIGADYLCHGSTGAGNDQVRFDMVFNIIAPEIEVIALIREKRLSREEEIAYLRGHGVNFDFKKAEYSINQGIWGTSVGGKETPTSSETLPEEAYPSQLKETQPRRVTLTFEKGEFVALDGKRFDDRIAAIQGVAGDRFAVCDRPRHAHRRYDHRDQRPRRFRSRRPDGDYQGAPHARKAYADQMAVVLERPDLGLLRQLPARGTVLRSGDARFRSVSRKHAAHGQRRRLRRTAPYRFVLVGIKSDHDLMSIKFGAYGETMNDWTSEDVKGFPVKSSATRIRFIIR